MERKMTLSVYYLLILIMVLDMHGKVTAVCSSAYGAKPCPYVPSLPGERPSCAKHGNTYCEYPEHYPRNLVMYLLEKWKYDHATLLQNESPNEFSNYYFHSSDTYGAPLNIIHAPSPVYGPPNSKFPYPPRRIPHSFTTTTITRENLTYYQPQDNLSALKARITLLGKMSDLHPAHFTQNAWTKWNERKYYMRRKRSLAAQRNDTQTMRRKRQSIGSGQTLCDSSARYIMPRAAMNNRGDWMFVANVPELDGRYSQLVRTESCIAQQCKSLCGLPDGFSSQCEQKYVQKRLIALEPSGGNLYTDVFWFPSCCLCTIVRN